MNRVELVGRVTRDPELRNSNSGDVKFVSFTIAIDRYRNAQGERQTDFINCVCFGRLAENFAQYVKKGALISVEGRLQSRTQQGNDGINRTMIDVVCETVNFLERKSDSQSQGQSNYQQPQNNYNQGYQQGYNQQPQNTYQNPNYNQPRQQGYGQGGYQNPQPVQQPQQGSSFNDFGSYQDNFTQPGAGNRNSNQQQDRKIEMPSFSIASDDFPF